MGCELRRTIRFHYAERCEIHIFRRFPAPQTIVRFSPLAAQTGSSESGTSSQQCLRSMSAGESWISSVSCGTRTDGSQVVAAGGGDKNLTLGLKQAGEELARYPTNTQGWISTIRMLARSDGSAAVAVGTSDGELCIFDASSGVEQVRRQREHRGIMRHRTRNRRFRRRSSGNRGGRWECCFLAALNFLLCCTRRVHLESESSYSGRLR